MSDIRILINLLIAFAIITYSCIGAAMYYDGNGRYAAENEIPNPRKRLLYKALHGPIVWFCIFISDIVAPRVFRIMDITESWFRK